MDHIKHKDQVDELHDSVRQRLFALSMHLGVVKVRLQGDVVTTPVTLMALSSLCEAERLIQQIHQELTSYRSTPAFSSVSAAQKEKAHD